MQRTLAMTVELKSLRHCLIESLSHNLPVLRLPFSSSHRHKVTQAQSHPVTTPDLP